MTSPTLFQQSHPKYTTIQSSLSRASGIAQTQRASVQVQHTNPHVLNTGSPTHNQSNAHQQITLSDGTQTKTHSQALSQDQLYFTQQASRSSSQTSLPHISLEVSPLEKTESSSTLEQHKSSFDSQSCNATELESQQPANVPPIFSGVRNSDGQNNFERGHNRNRSLGNEHSQGNQLFYKGHVRNRSLGSISAGQLRPPYSLSYRQVSLGNLSVVSTSSLLTDVSHHQYTCTHTHTQTHTVIGLLISILCSLIQFVKHQVLRQDMILLLISTSSPNTRQIWLSSIAHYPIETLSQSPLYPQYGV